MNFIKMEFIPGLILAFVALLLIVGLNERRFFRMVKTYWFYSRSLFSYIASFLFLAGMGLLLMSLLDARGPEEKIKTEAPTQRTIILIDTSASMLAEDVKPSRLSKAVLIAKHFARKAAGQQIAVVVFAEIQKKIVPFTNDLDLIDARLDTIKNLKNNYGSSALSVAIQESIQYFKEAGNEAQGNLLVLTDGEETADGVKLNVPKDIHVAFVGIGTEQGGRIPLDDGRGLRYGYKKNAGKDVITKINERFFERTTSDLPSAKYWLANSYTLPSDEIVEFFQGEMSKGQNEQDMIVRPVMMEWIVLPALALMAASYLFKAFRIFTLGILILISPGWSQDKPEEDEGPKYSEETILKLDNLQQGKLSKLEKIKLADDLHKSGAIDEALQLYRENLSQDIIDPQVPPEAYMNYGTGLLQKNKTADGLNVYQKLSESLNDSKESSKLKDMITKNTLSHFMKKEEQKKKEEQEKKDQKKQDQNKDQNKDQKNQNQSGESKDQKNQNSQGDSGQQKPQDGQNQPQDKKDQNGEGKDQQEKKDKGEEEKDKKEQGDKDKDGKEGEDKDENQKNEGAPEESEQKKNMPPKKLPAKLKQLMSDDRQLQMKVIENGTRDLNRKRHRNSKDW